MLVRGYAAVLGRSEIPSANNYTPGGTGIATFGAIPGNVKQSGNDKIGRWSYQIFDSQKKIDIMVVSIYQCCISPKNMIGTAAYHQQQIMQLGQDRTDTNPGRNFRTNLLKFLENHLSNPDKPTIPFILGDWNKPHEGQSTSKKICEKFGLVDIWKTLQPDHSNFSTYQQGTTRIDYALTTVQATCHIQNIRYEQYQLRMTGDHRDPIFDINTNFLFGPDSEAYPSMQK